MEAKKKKITQGKNVAHKKRNKKASASKKQTLFPKLLHWVPSWSWWIGGGTVVVLYIWIFYSFFVGPTGFRWRALYGDPNYPEGYEIHGIDISHYQGKINWDALRNAMIERCPVRFVIIKSTEGAGHLDKNFEDNFFQAREHGFIRGAYHFWSNRSKAREQA